MTSDPKALPVIKSVETHVYEALRERIVRGVYAPLTPLRLAPFAAELGVSTQPVRAAILRLQGEGLVQTVPRRGSVVAPLELNDLEEIQAIRSAIEGFAARVGAERIDSAGIQSMERGLEALRHVTTLDDYIATEWECYSHCYAVAGRAGLLGLIADYRRRAERYIRVSLEGMPAFGDAVEYQRRLIDACIAHDGEAAERVIHESIAWTIPHIAPIIASLEQQAG
jgi:DNA-binding GntR family transcriptional regulator